VPDRALRRRLAADAALLAVATSWGATFPLAKRLLTELPPFFYLALRFSLAAALLFAVAGRQLPKLGKRGLADGAILGALLTAGYGFQTVGLRTASATVAAFLTGLSVVMVPLLGALGGRRPAVLAWIGVACALVGLALLTLQRGAGMRFGVGEFLLLCCALAFAVHIVYQSRVASRWDAMPLGLVQITVVALLTLLFSLGERHPSAITPYAAWALIFMAVVCSAAAFTIQAWAQRFTPATHVGLLFAFEPVAAAIFAWAWLGERLSGGQWLGAGFILAGIVLAEWTPSPGSA
jgi:drug/metabolite transporter (DMT)-like permease